MKRMKVPDYKDKNVFGVPLIVHVQRSGHPLPLGLQQALRYLRSQCLDQVSHDKHTCLHLICIFARETAVDLSPLFFFQVGLFRKSGVKSRIQALRQMNESSPDNVNYEDQSAYDVADMVKQFFRDLPEPLLTSKLGETFLHIYQCKQAGVILSGITDMIKLKTNKTAFSLFTRCAEGPKAASCAGSHHADVGRKSGGLADVALLP